jgi:basic membrane protein A
MKKWLILAMTVVLLGLLISGCGGASGASESSPASTAEDKKKVALLTGLGGLGDEGFNDQAFKGLNWAEEAFKVETKVLEPKDISEIETMQRNVVKMGYDLVILNGFDHLEALEKVATDFPNTAFVMIDGGGVMEAENIASAIYSTHEGSFLAGALAAMRSKSGIIGFVGGMEIPTIQRFQVGYEEGAKYVNPDIVVKSMYIGSDSASAFANPTGGKNMALDLAKQGVDVVYAAAGGSGVGVINGAQEAGILAIGCNFDQKHLAPETVISSMLTKGEVVVHQMVQRFVDGEKLTGRYDVNLENGGVDLTYDGLSKDETAQLIEIKNKIIAGEIKVTDVFETI